MIQAELKAGEHLPTERWRKDVLRALDLLEAELYDCDDYPGFFKSANGGGNSLYDRSIVLYDRLGDKLNYFAKYEPATPLVSSGRYLLITTWIQAFDDPRHLATPLDGLYLCGPTSSRSEDDTGMAKLRKDWLNLLYGQVDVDLISEMVGCGAIPPEVELGINTGAMLKVAAQVIDSRAFNFYAFADGAAMSPDYYAMLTKTLLEVLDEVYDLDAYGDERTNMQRLSAWFLVRSRIEERYGRIRGLVDIANLVLGYRNDDELARLVWVIQRHTALAAAIAA